MLQLPLVVVEYKFQKQSLVAGFKPKTHFSTGLSSKSDSASSSTELALHSNKEGTVCDVIIDRSHAAVTGKMTMQLFSREFSLVMMFPNGVS